MKWVICWIYIDYPQIESFDNCVFQGFIKEGLIENLEQWLKNLPSA